MSRHTPVLVVHGGTGLRPSSERLQTIRKSLEVVADNTYRYLRTHSAVEAVALAVRRLEDDPLFNAGTGSYLQQDGRVRMSASVMDGSTATFAAVLNLERVKNPILVARTLLHRQDRVLAGPEATRYAQSLGMPPWNPITPERLRHWRQQRRGAHGTVGALALDVHGRLAAATSTGGKGFDPPGRVSDSGMPVGNYATADVAVSCTGVGEDIIDEGVAVRIAQRVADGASLKQACATMHRAISRRKRRFGVVGLDRRGHPAWWTTLPMLFAIAQNSSGQTASF